MILIDKYELIKELSKRKYSRASLQLIMDQPEVKAIPIDWIEEWGWKNGMSESMSLRVMIEDWEKENDKGSE